MELEPISLGEVLDSCIEAAIPVNASLVVSLRDGEAPAGVRVVPVTGLTVSVDGSAATVTLHAEADDGVAPA
ncbi:hypothetical protein KSP35_22235 [Aquihabitans sp. G128]|uniref:hypothetical protein n=1 Tax=Aquihabitans sp. G128 TaxID=2849779 RepID=UPI001C245E80|nr:hypothetical protein [Aquihabitans sp. G128]QXC60998.1 hypothetical protein KSP35_22235 [Aquihabitans sp. G128]